MKILLFRFLCFLNLDDQADSITSQYQISSLPSGNATQGLLPPTGQVYVVLSTADGTKVKAADENTISGVGVLEVNAK